MWVLLCVLSQGMLLDSVSFQSPFFPDHSGKFYMLGSAIPLHTGVRVVPPTSRKAGALVALSALPPTDLTLELTCSHGGKQRAEDQGALTLWFAPVYSRHVAVGTFFGVSERMDGLLLVYDYQRGLLGYEKTGETAVDPDQVGRDHHCSVQLGATFTLFLALSSDSLTVEYGQDGRKNRCFSMPVTRTYERFLGISAYSGYPCQRGLEIVSLQISVQVRPEQFVVQMTSLNDALSALLLSIHTQYAAALVKPELSPEDRRKIRDTLQEIKGKLEQMTGRLAKWKEHWESVLLSERSDEVTAYGRALEQAFSGVEGQLQELASAVAGFDLTSLVQRSLSSQRELAGNEAHISALVTQMQREVSWYAQEVQEEHSLGLVGALALVGALGVYLYWSAAKAKKKHDI